MIIAIYRGLFECLTTIKPVITAECSKFIIFHRSLEKWIPINLSRSKSILNIKRNYSYYTGLMMGYDLPVIQFDLIEYGVSMKLTIR